MPMWFAEEVSSGVACVPVSTMAQTATTISAIERLEGEYATVLTLVSYGCCLTNVAADGRGQVVGLCMFRVESPAAGFGR
jgi:hypothetical protein